MKVRIKRLKLLVDKFDFGGLGVWYINRLTMSWVIVIIDLCSIFILLVAVCIIPTSVVNRTNFYNLTKILISDFSIHIKDLDLKGNIIYQEISDVIGHVNKVMEQKDKLYNKDNLIIYDINYPIMTLQQVDLLVDKTEYLLEIEELNDKAEKTGKNEDYYEKVRELERKIREVKVELASSFEESLDDTDDVFLTFVSHRQKQLFKRLYDVSASKRCLYKCCGKADYDNL